MRLPRRLEEPRVSRVSNLKFWCNVLISRFKHFAAEAWTLLVRHRLSEGGERETKGSLFIIEKEVLPASTEPCVP